MIQTTSVGVSKQFQDVRDIAEAEARPLGNSKEKIKADIAVQSPERPINKESLWKGTPTENRLFSGEDKFRAEYQTTDDGSTHIVLQ